MKNLVIACLLGACLSMYLTGSDSGETIKDLSVRLEKERSFNVRRARRLHYMDAPKKINMEGVALALDIEGTRPSVTAALLFCENGPENMESGSIDKSAFFARHVPIEHRSALEGARTLNRMAWEWFVTTPRGQVAMRDFLLYAAKPYTALGLGQQGAWAAAMRSSIQRYEKEIQVVSVGGDPVAYVMRTPTPDYGYDAVKVKNPTRRAHSRRKQ